MQEKGHFNRHTQKEFYLLFSNTPKDAALRATIKTFVREHHSYIYLAEWNGIGNVLPDPHFFPFKVMKKKIFVLFRPMQLASRKEHENESYKKKHVQNLHVCVNSMQLKRALTIGIPLATQTSKRPKQLCCTLKRFKRSSSRAFPLPILHSK